MKLIIAAVFVFATSATAQSTWGPVTWEGIPPDVSAPAAAPSMTMAPSSSDMPLSESSFVPTEGDIPDFDATLIPTESGSPDFIESSFVPTTMDMPDVGSSLVPTGSEGPSFSMAPFMDGSFTMEMTCEANTECVALNLTGLCCPTTENVFLDCCDEVIIEPTCDLNEVCSMMNLTGACCPTTDAEYLDCCDFFPENGTIISTMSYLLDSSAVMADAKSSDIASGAWKAAFAGCSAIASFILMVLV